MALNVAALAGDILLASGAEIFRVEETIDRIAHAYGIDSCDPFVLSSGFSLQPTVIRIKTSPGCVIFR